MRVLRNFLSNFIAGLNLSASPSSASVYEGRV